MYICQLARRLGYPIASVHLGQNTKLTLITIVWKSQCPACLSNHVFSHYCQQSLSRPLWNSDRVQFFPRCELERRRGGLDSWVPSHPCHNSEKCPGGNNMAIRHILAWWLLLCFISIDMENDNCRPGPQIMEMVHMWRMANDPFVQVETTKRLLFPTDDPPEANTLRLGTEELESELAETPRSILSTTSRHEVNIFSSALLSLIV